MAFIQANFFSRQLCTLIDKYTFCCVSFKDVIILRNFPMERAVSLVANFIETAGSQTQTKSNAKLPVRKTVTAKVFTSEVVYCQGSAS